MEIHLNGKQLRALQLVQFDMLKEVDRICRKNNIAYSLAGGTLLGAVRHKGYIPWDDDADVVLLRPEYERLAEIFDQVTDSEKYYFQDADNTTGYRWGFGKIRRKHTLWLRDGQENLPFEQEICIDVFPLDRVPNGIIKSKLHNIHCFLIRKIMWSEVGKHTAPNLPGRLFYRSLSCIPFKAVLKHYHSFTNKYNIDKYNMLRVLMWPTPNNLDYEGKTEWYSNYTEVEFEGHCFKAMHKYDEYLELKYGDYMQLPPESERITHSISQLQLLSEEEEDYI